MANTVIQLKYSTITNKPPTLNVAEPAYSNVSNTLWIDDGTGVVAIGGKAYTDKIDAAASAATANVLVKRDTTGNASFNYITANVVGSIYGNATSADKWFTPRNIGVSGDANGIISVDGTANANIPLVLGNSGVAAGNYGSVTQIPTFAVDSKGRITSASNVSISTTLNIAGDIGTDAVALATDTITFKGGDGITSNVFAANTTVILDVDNTVLRNSGNQFISGDLSLTGSLYVAGNTTTVDTTTVSTADSLIRLAANNTVSDVLDIGFYGVANTNGSTTYHGLVRRAGTGNDFFLFKNLNTDPTSNVLATGSVTAANTATLRANLTGGMISALANTIGVVDGGTGAGTFATGSILVGDGTNSLKVLANTGTAGAYGSASNTLIVTTDAYGRVSAITNSAIQIDASNIVSGTLGIARGGSGASSFSVKGVIVSDAASTTGALSALTSPTEGHLLQINSSGAPTFAHLNGGTF